MNVLLRRLARPTLLLLSLLLAPGLAAQHAAQPVVRPCCTYTTQPVSGEEARAWREDLHALVEALEHIHPDPYHHVSTSAFERAVARLEADIPGLAAHEVVTAFARLLARVGDGHTSLQLYADPAVGFHVLPIRLGVYDDGVYVEAADARYADLVGSRVLAVGGVAMHEALERAATLISRDNDNAIATIAPFLLNRIEVLHALRLASDLGGAEMTVEADGRTRTLRVAPLPHPVADSPALPLLPAYSSRWVDARDAADAPIPHYQRRFEDVYWWEYLPEHDVLYVKWDQVRNRASGPTALDTFREAMAFAREHRPRRTVVDIRNNTGGEGTLGRAVIREIVRTREIDEPGRLFVVIGRRTFSAAQMLASWFEQFTEAILVGEPSSAYYNGYAGHGPHVVLPRSGIGIRISDAYYQMGATPHDTRRQATPRLAAVPTFEAYRSNRDVALEAILAYEPDALYDDLLAALAAGDAARAERAVRAFAAAPVNRYTPARTELNALGYRLLHEGRLIDAVGVFELNVRVHPDYANGWDSLGEAYVAADRLDDAVAAFRRALTLQPDLAASRAWLHRLGAEQP